MNVYDFDKTICKDDTESDFLFFECKRHPINILLSPYYLFFFLIRKVRLISVEKYRSSLYLTLKFIKDLDKELDLFWAIRKKKIMKWYLANKKDDDLIISASPLFLLEPIFKELNIKNYITSSFDLNKRKYVGKINEGEEKVKNYLKLYQKEDINNFYTDSKIDLPMMKLAKKAYIIKKCKPIEYKF